MGRDQVQHIEMARDMASSFNHLYGEHFTLPEAQIDEAVALLPGLDGRKMSKSYDNTIALFAPREQMRKQIFSIVTDSRAPGEPKDTEGSALFQIYQAFADEAETAALRKAYAEGIAWADAKQLLFERIDREIAPDARSATTRWCATPRRSSASCGRAPTRRARCATPFMGRLRHAVGLRNLADQPQAAAKAKAESRPALVQAIPREPTAATTSSWSMPAARCCCKARGFDVAAGSRPRRRAAQAGQAWPAAQAARAAAPTA